MNGAKSFINRFPTIRRAVYRGPEVALCSMGGVGSTALARHIGSIADKTVREHAFSPAVYDDENQVRLGYMFGNPYNSVLSIFRRGYQEMHANAMNVNSGTKPSNLKNVGLEAYLEKGVDEFRTMRQLENWTNPALVKHPTILIKYEDLAGNVDKVLEFFGCDKPFEFKARNSAWESQPAHIKDGLEKVYGELFRKIEAMPAITILEPEMAK